MYVKCAVNSKKNLSKFHTNNFLLYFQTIPLKCQWGQFQGNYNDSNSKVILPFIIVDFYSLKAHFHTKQEIGMLYVTLRNW